MKKILMAAGLMMVMASTGWAVPAAPEYCLTGAKTCTAFCAVGHGGCQHKTATKRGCSRVAGAPDACEPSVRKICQCVI